MGAATWTRWWEGRHPRTDHWRLTQRNVYILPTGAGWLYALLLVALLLGSINYQLNLGYLLTFVLASAGVVAIHATHATLRGLELHLLAEGPVPPRVHVGQTIELAVELNDTLRRGPVARWIFLGRHGIGLRWAGAAEHMDHGETWVDVPTGGRSSVRLGLTPGRRGVQTLPTIRVETRFPLGLLRAWTVWRPATSLLAWPAAEADAPALPPLAQGDEAAPDPAAPPPITPRAAVADLPESDGVRAWRRGDSPSQVLWRLSARALDSGGELLVREQSPPPQRARVLAWAHTAALGADAETRISRLTAWVLAADRAGLRTRLRLPGVDVAEGVGALHRLACLDALAACAPPSSAEPPASRQKAAA